MDIGPRPSTREGRQKWKEQNDRLKAKPVVRVITLRNAMGELLTPAEMARRDEAEAKLVALEKEIAYLQIRIKGVRDYSCRPKTREGRRQWAIKRKASHKARINRQKEFQPLLTRMRRETYSHKKFLRYFTGGPDQRHDFSPNLEDYPASVRHAIHVVAEDHRENIFAARKFSDMEDAAQSLGLTGKAFYSALGKTLEAISNETFPKSDFKIRWLIPKWGPMTPLSGKSRSEPNLEEWRIIDLITERGPLTVTELVMMIGGNRSTISRRVSNLIRFDKVVRKPDYSIHLKRLA